MHLETDEEYRTIYNNFRRGNPYNVSYLSDNFFDMYISNQNYNYKDEYDLPTYKLLKCPICFYDIWESAFECLNCNKYMCEVCINTMLRDSKRHNKDFNCPFCRYLIYRPEPQIRDLPILSQRENNNLSYRIFLFILLLSVSVLIIYISFYQYNFL